MDVLKFTFKIEDENIIKLYYLLLHGEEMSFDEFMNQLIDELWVLLIQTAGDEDNDTLKMYLENALKSEVDKENAINYLKNYKGRG